MSTELSANSTTDQGAPKSRKAVSKKLSTGHKITLTPQDDRTLKIIYEFMSGYAKRKQIEAALEAKKREVDQALKDIPAGAKILMKQRAAGVGIGATASSSLYGGSKHGIDTDDDITTDAVGHVDESSRLDNNLENSTSSGAPAVDNRTEGELKVDQYYKVKEQLTKLEDKLKLHMLNDHKISFKDIDSVVRSLGTMLTKKQIEQMIWEVDENLDDFIDYDEFQLTYFRNITDSTGNEPCSFFRVVEFMIFDGSHKGYIIEDDCMEILYARYGGGHLEQEMKLLFGNRLRAEGGDGTLNFDSYSDSVLGRTGRRALIF